MNLLTILINIPEAIKIGI